MPATERLLTRIRGEYREMPGLRLTQAQARRLWHVDAPTCQAVLNELVGEGFLTQTRDGSFVATTAPGQRVGVAVA